MSGSGRLIALVLWAGCAGDDVSDQCPGRVTQAVLAEDRNIIGQGGAYPADMMLQGREEDLYRSQRLRRESAWQTVGKILSPVALNVAPPNVEATSLPLWHTWYAKDDAERLFRHLFEGLPAEEQATHSRFDQQAIDEAFGWNVDAIDDLDNWPAERRQAYLDAINSQDKLAGVGGVSQVSYSPGALRHMMRSYPEVLDCAESGTPVAVTGAAPGDTTQEAVREAVDLAGCQSLQLGPFFVAEGESLSAELSGDGAEAASAAVSGERSQYVTISAGKGAAFRGAVQIDYQSPNTPWAACLESAFPRSAVVVKASWQRTQFSATLPTYETSAVALQERLRTSDWAGATGEADPQSDSIYSIELANGHRYRLAALHIMTKELQHWQWITLWWSDTPDTDFGEDRPGPIRELGGPWSNYKMCVTTNFLEGDPDPSGGYSETAPSLAAALAAVHGGTASPSWCSNPYLEEGAGNMATNCIGCHQHGGTDLLSEDIIADEGQFPAHGRTQLRNNFPHDYSWAVSDGDRLGASFKAVVDYFE